MDFAKPLSIDKLEHLVYNTFIHSTESTIINNSISNQNYSPFNKFMLKDVRINHKRYL